MKTTDQELEKLARTHGNLKAHPEIRSMYPSESRGVMAHHFGESFKEGYRQAESDTIAKVLAMLRGEDAALEDFNSRPYGVSPNDWATWLETEWKNEKE